MWNGKEGNNFTSIARRVIYRVIEKEPAGTSSLSKHCYGLAAVFDFENPVGMQMSTVKHNGTRDMKRLSLIDLATIRLHYDNFIKEWAKHAYDKTEPGDV